MSSCSTGPLGDRGTPHCSWNVIATQPIGLVPFQGRCIPQRPEEQSRTGSCQGSNIAGQPQCPRLWHSSNPNARFLSHSPSAPPPPFTQSPYPPRSLVRDGQTHPHRPRLVVSHSTCPPLSSSPHAHSFVIGPAVIKHTHPEWVRTKGAEGAKIGRGWCSVCWHFHQFDRHVTTICPVCKVHLCADGCFLQWHREHPDFGATYCGWGLHKGKS